VKLYGPYDIWDWLLYPPAINKKEPESEAGSLRRA